MKPLITKAPKKTTTKPVTPPPAARKREPACRIYYDYRRRVIPEPPCQALYRFAAGSGFCAHRIIALIFVS